MLFHVIVVGIRQVTEHWEHWEHWEPSLVGLALSRYDVPHVNSTRIARLLLYDKHA